MILAIYRLIALVGVTFVMACGSSGDDGGDDADLEPIDAGVVDARPREDDADSGPEPPECAVVPSYGDLGTPDVRRSEVIVRVNQNNFVEKMIYQAIINDDVDVVQIELFNGFTVFENGLREGTFEITGEELDYATCGVCVRIFGDVGPLGDVRQVYMATGGTVTIRDLGLSSIDGRFLSDLVDIELEHVTIHPETFESIPVGDGCRSRITEMHTDSPVFQ
jgi:hypothetical protein